MHPYQGFDRRDRAESCSYLIHGIGKSSRVALIADDDRVFDGTAATGACSETGTAYNLRQW